MKYNTNVQLIRYFIYCRDKGFTLVELLVVVVIVGVLAAVAIPNHLAQIGKARETEAKTSLGALARAQQVYHFETKSFYNGNDLSSFADINIIGQYYVYTVDNTANQNKAIHSAYAISPGTLLARDFSIGIYFDAPSYTQILCIADSIDNNGNSSSVEAQADGTCLGGSKIK
ncbi:type IV pilin-like G/H family protein [Myxosarcina sp. GI1(2024)]